MESRKEWIFFSDILLKNIPEIFMVIIMKRLKQIHYCVLFI